MAATSLAASLPAAQNWESLTPEQRVELEAELALDRLLGKLPVAVAPTNLAARVLNEVAREDRTAQTVGPSWLRRLASRWTRRRSLKPLGIGLAAALAVVGVVSQRSHENRMRMAREVAEVTEVTAIPGVDALRNFDAISALGADARLHPSDVELMAAMVPVTH
jgi:anti-sigma factor RsiW